MLGFFNKNSQKDQKLHVIVRDMSKIIYEGEVFALSSTNERGPFDILPFHNNFIALLEKKITIHMDRKQRMEIPIETGILRQVSNKVEVFVGVEHIAQQMEQAQTAAQIDSLDLTKTPTAPPANATAPTPNAQKAL